MKQAMILISLFCSLSLSAADLFITPDSSLTEAVRKAREMRRLGKATEVTIHLAAGTYSRCEPLRLRPEDSGLYIEGDRAVISGGMRISNWKKQGKLWVADVPDFNGRPIDFRQLYIIATPHSQRENGQRMQGKPHGHAMSATSSRCTASAPMTRRTTCCGFPRRR